MVWFWFDIYYLQNQRLCKEVMGYNIVNLECAGRARRRRRFRLAKVLMNKRKDLVRTKAMPERGSVSHSNIRIKASFLCYLRRRIVHIAAGLVTRAPLALPQK